jgi:hypothetical protein
MRYNENFLVICDETNNPQEIVDQKMLRIDVYLKVPETYAINFTVDKDGKVDFVKSKLEGLAK